MRHYRRLRICSASSGLCREFLRGRERPPLAREERVQAVLSQRTRTKYTDGDKNYSLRDSEIHTLSEVGKFRVVATRGLAEFAYNNDRSRTDGEAAVKGDPPGAVSAGMPLGGGESGGNRIHLLML